VSGLALHHWVWRHGRPFAGGGKTVRMLQPGQPAGTAAACSALLTLGNSGLCRQWLFLLEGAATVVFGVVLRLCLAPSPAKARMLSHEEREWLQQEQDAARAATAAACGGRQRRGTLSERGNGVGSAILGVLLENGTAK